MSNITDTQTLAADADEEEEDDKEKKSFASSYCSTTQPTEF